MPESKSNCLDYGRAECDISSRDFSVSRLFSIFWEYRYLSQKFRSWKKKSVSVSKIFGLEKKSPIGLQNIWSQKKSRYRSRKDSVSKKSLSIGLKNFGLKKVSVSVSKTLVSKKVLAMLISFSKEIQVILLMILSHKEFQYQSQKFWSNYWSWYIAKGTKAKALRTLTHSTPLVQSRSSNKLWNLDQTFAYFFLAKGEKYIELWQIHVTT